MNVALCDDNVQYIEKFSSRLKEYECNIYKYNSVKALIESGLSFDIAFLDIEVNKETGFNAAKYVYAKNHNCIIIFLTNYSKYMLKGYEFRAYRYILKNSPDILISKRINEAFNEYYKQNKVITGSYNGYDFYTYAKDILYIESNRHAISIHTVKGVYRKLSRISDVEKSLEGTNIIRCHRGFMVNLDYVYAIRDGKFFTLIVPNEIDVPIGKTYRSIMKNEYAKRFRDGVL